MAGLEFLIEKVMQKKELSSLNKEFVKEEILNCLRKNNLSVDRLHNLKLGDFRLIIKETRKSLRKFSGSFQKNAKKGHFFLKKNNIEELLKTHSSTKERFSDYSEIFNEIKNLKIKSILDIGSGLNPLAFSRFFPDAEYHALDINESDISIVNEFFKKENIKGSAFVYDIRKIKADNLPSTDLCLLFKIFDIIETKEHKLAEKIILNLNCKYLLISFSTKTLSGKPMNHPQRGWVERLLSRLGFSFRFFKIKNEIFYLASKEPILGDKKI